MHNIYLNSKNKGYDFESFQEEMIQKCNNLRNQNRAMAFAFILYDFENPQVKEILDKHNYWLTLDEISGEYLTIFSLNYDEKKIIFERQQQRNDHIGFMVNVPINTSPSVGTNILIERYFGNSIEVKYPAILFFQVDNEKVVDSLLVNLNERYIEPAFEELETLIRSAVGALKDIKLDYRDNIKDIFDSLERSVASTDYLRKVKRKAKVAGNIFGLFSSISGLFS